MKYTKLFETTAQYNAYTADTANFIKPNVSVAKDAPTTVYLNQKTDPCGGHDYIEIAGLKWSTMNLGATGVTDYGLYYQWGDTQGYTSGQCGSGSEQKFFDCTDYKYKLDDECYTYTKYNHTDGKLVLEASDDAATVAWGGNWRMPTLEEFQALGNAVDTAITESYNNSGVEGLLCTDKTDNSKVLFFPFTGYCYGEKFYPNKLCYLWSSTLLDGNEEFARLMSYIKPYSVLWEDDTIRIKGASIRPVAD